MSFASINDGSLIRYKYDEYYCRVVTKPGTNARTLVQQLSDIYYFIPLPFQIIIRLIVLTIIFKASPRHCLVVQAGKNHDVQGAMNLLHMASVVVASASIFNKAGAARRFGERAWVKTERRERHVHRKNERESVCLLFPLRILKERGKERGK